ncbi:MAG: hypothetical protein ACI8PZ_001655 [Myxococcota bacterium]
MTQLARHRAALVGLRRCPACAEPLRSRSLLHGDPCPRCESTLANVGLDAEAAAAPLHTGLWRRLGALAIGVAIGNLVLGWVPLLGAVVLLLSTVWLKIGLVDPVTASFSRARRMVSRFTAKLLLVLILVGFVLVVEVAIVAGPLAGPVKAGLGALQPLIAGAVVAAYLRWQLAREIADKRLLVVEWAGLVLLGASLVLATAALVGGLVALAAVFQTAMEHVGVLLGVS